MTLDFNKFAAKGNEFVHHLEANLGDNDRAHAARILRSTLRVLRNHLTIEESFQLLSQLPMPIKAVYVDGWSLADHRKIKSVDEFLLEVLQQEGNNAWRDFSTRQEVIDCVRAVVDTMRVYVSAEELEQAFGTLPKDLKYTFESTEY